MTDEPALLRIAEEVSAGARDAEVLRAGRDDSTTLRVRLDDATAVLKLWNRPGVRGDVRRWTGTGPADREWAMLRLVADAGVRAPRAIARLRLRGPGARHTDALFTEDLGPCEFALDYVKKPLAAGDEAEVTRIEEGFIDATARLIGARVLDPDNRATNYVVRTNGELVRMDFEIARVVWSPAMRPRMYGATLGVLIGSYAFAVQPQAWRAEAFALRLADRVRPPRRALQAAGEYVEGMMRKQRERAGVDTRVRLAW